MFLEKVLKFNEENKLFSRGDRIVVGVSGGKDSVCLLDVLDRCREEWELSLLVVHVNHGLRGEAADRDEAFVETLANERGLPFYRERVDVREIAAERKMTEEEAGRYVRYQIMKHVCIEKEYNKIAVAHHQDDVAETVLFQMFRGSGPRGLSGIFPKREYIIRPILFAARSEIDEYVEQNGLAYCVDDTNFDEKYCRNKIRLRVFPYVEKEINNRAAEHVAKAARKIAQQYMYIDRQAKREYMKIVHVDRGEYYYFCEEFDQLDIVLKVEVIRLILKNFSDSVKDITETHYEMLMSLSEKEAGKRVVLPGSICAEKRYGCVRYKINIERKERIFQEKCEMPFEGLVEVRKERMRIYMDVIPRDEIPQNIVPRNDVPRNHVPRNTVPGENLLKEIPQKDYTKWFDYDKIKNSVCVRNPMEGDFFVMDAGGKRKRLSRYYIDEKIPASERKKEIVLADGNHVLWAVPGRISAAYKVTEETKRVLVVMMALN